MTGSEPALGDHTAVPPILDDGALPPASDAALRGQAMSRALMRPFVRRLRLTPSGLRLLRVLTGAPNRLIRPVRGTTIRQVRSERVRGEWVTAPGVHGTGRALLYLHGSAFTLLSASSHRGLVSRLSDRTGLPAFSVDYRLAPEHPFPAASDDVMAAYRYLLDNGIDASDVAVAGDSAGAFLAVDLTLQLARRRAPLPAAVVLFSPLVDLTLQLAAAQEQLSPDPLVSARDCRRLVDLYVGGADRTDPRLTVTFDGIDQFPPTLIQTGGHEMLQADARHLHALIRASGSRSYLQVWPGQGHVFQAMTSLPEASAALREAALFLAWTLRRTTGAGKGQL
ncbi:alpha/beta hydrolase [Mycobacterium sp. pUA109]|uniref:alpha/beta hydrolase n=1 Tax=Mycobacterium sp. pUA109 TaxID=3238982 RepID=UPI00351BDAE4